MNRLFSIGIIFFCAISCTSIESNKTLTDVESYIIERPDSALSVLESMNREDLVTNKNKAHHALLHAMALDKNYIDVTDDSIAMVAVDYYQKRGSAKNRVKSLYYLGVSYYNAEDYDKAILTFSRAKDLAIAHDSLYLGMIYSAMSYTYNCNYNSSQELYYAKYASDIFSSINADQYSRASKYRLAVAYHNSDYYEKAIEEYDSLLTDSSDVDIFTLQSIIGKAHSMIEIDSIDYHIVDSLF